MSIRPDDDDPTIADGKVIDGEVIDSSIVDTPTADDELTARLRALSMEIDDSPAELGEQTTATLHALAAEAGDPPADLHHVVLAGARRTRRRRYAVTGMTALAVLAISGTVVASVSRASDQGTDRLTAAAPVSPMPLPTTDSVIAPPADAPSPTPSASASVSASAGRGAVPGAVPAGPGAPAGPGRPAPAPTTTKPQVPPPAPLKVTVITSNTSPTVGQPVTFRLYWTDGDGRFAGTSADWDEQSDQPGGGDAAIERGCKPAPGNGVTELQHTFTTAGHHQVKLELLTYNCHNYRLESVMTVVPIEVSPAPSGTTPVSPSAG